MLILLAACTYISAEDHAARLAELAGGLTHTGTDTGTGALALDSLSPSYGTDAGGTVVTLHGGPFDDSSEVYFGTARADVVDVTRDVLTVQSPASSVTGSVSVTLSSGGDSVQRDAAYTYYADATGFVGATGELTWYAAVGGYWGTKDEDYGRSTLRFVEAFDYEYFLYWAPELDTCVRITEGVPEYTYDPIPEAIDAGGGTLAEIADSARIDLTWSSAEQRFTAYDLERTKFADGEAYDLVLTGAPALPDFTLETALPFPAPFRVSSPNIFADNLPPITEDQHFEWDTENPGDAALLQLGLVNADDSGFEQELFCALRDVGSFTVPDGTWTRWTTGRVVNVLVGRYNSGDGLVPWNQGRIATASSYWNYGAATSR